MKFSSLQKRTLSTLTLLSYLIFISIIGNIAINITIIIFLSISYIEIIQLINKKNNENLNFIEKIIPYLLLISILLINQEIIIFKYLEIIGYLIISLSLILFVINLKEENYEYSFKRIGWIFGSLFIIIIQGLKSIELLNYNIEWFLLPIILVFTNDIFAFIFGKSFGKHKLIKISPNKTWEGFIGGGISTILIGYFLIPKIFKNSGFTGFQLIFLSLYSSIITPFGGFFGSGLKRYLKIKDFGNSIPGHGGFTDRLDCHFFMISFTYYFLKTLKFQR